jgi:hypothetical protein
MAKRLSKGAVIGLLGILCIACLAITGCGTSEGSQGGEASGGESKEAEPANTTRPAAFDPIRAKHEVRDAIHSLQNPDVACGNFSSVFLSQNYGAPGLKGRERCEKEVAGREPTQIRGFKFVKVDPHAIAVIVTDSRKAEVLLRFRLIDDKWLVDSASKP